MQKIIFIEIIFLVKMQAKPVTSDDPRAEFSFPFPPYQIQAAFMKELFETIDQGMLLFSKFFLRLTVISGKVGLFESPTGTVMK